MKKLRLACLVLAAFVLTAPCAGAATVTWITPGPSTNNWFDANNWSGTAVPTNADEVVITNINIGVLLTNSTAELSSLLISNTAKLIFTNWNSILNASNVTIGSSAQMIVAAWPTNGSNSNNLYIICSNLTVQGGGSIDATARGYPGVYGGDGLGPGGGSGSTVSGTHGGTGYGNGKSTYGDAAMPLIPGSAGGASSTYTGGAGGGAIRIEATGNVTVNGTIKADGNMPGATYSSAGSGGAIYIQCDTIQGTGLVSAAGEGNGSSSTYSKGGGGGRIAVIYNTASQAGIGPVPSIMFRLTTALSAGSGATQVGQPGTLYFPDNYFLASPFRYTAQWLVPAFTNWSFDSLIITNGCLWLPATGFVMTVTNDLIMAGTNQYLHQLRMLGGAVRVGRNISLTKSRLWLLQRSNFGSDLACGSNFVIGTGATVYAYSSATNATFPSYGAYLSITGELAIASDGVLYLYCNTTNGGAPFVQAQAMTIVSGGLVDATGTGFSPTNAGSNGNGPGAGSGAPSSRGGGGHGGQGGNNAGGYGLTNGSPNTPLNAGSSGGGYSTTKGGAGGGVVHFNVLGTLTLNGTINADGANGAANSGGGSGGSIWLQCRALAGSGSLSANGGNGTATAGGGGGGGRIAVWRMYDVSMNITNSVTGGTGASVADGNAGTFVWVQIPVPGTIFSFH